MRVMLGAITVVALVLAGGGNQAATAQQRTPPRTPVTGLVPVSVEGRFAGLVRPETLIREAANGMTRQTAPVRPRALAAAANPVTLTVHMIDRNGVTLPVDPYDMSVSIQSLEERDTWYSGPAGEIELPAGRYVVRTLITTPQAGREPTYSLIAHPELVLTGDTDLTLDARTGHRVSMSTGNPAVRGGDYNVLMASKVSGCSCTFGEFIEVDPRFEEVYAATVPGTRSDTFALGHVLNAFQPELELVSTGAEPFDVPAFWLSGSPTPVQRVSLDAVFAGTGEDLAGLDLDGKLVLLQLPGDIGADVLLERLAAVAAAGGRAAMLTFTDIPAALTSADEGEELGTPALPTMYGFGPTVQRFFDQVRAGGSGVDLVSRGPSAVRYQLAQGVLGAVTAPVTYRPATGELAAVPTTYHEAGPAHRAGVHAAMPFFGTTLATTWDIPVDTPQRRIEYYTPGQWDLVAGDLADTRRFVAGANPPLAWDKAVAGPSFTGTTFDRETRGQRFWAYRDGDAIDVIMPMLGDSAGRPRKPSVNAGDTGSISLSRDGKKVGAVDVPDAARFAVPAEPAGYRLSAKVTRATGLSPLSTTVTADWTFRSGPADSGKPLPLLTVRYDPAVNPVNSAPGGRAFTIPTYASGATSLTVDVSYDDGVTWRPATVRGAKGRFAVTVDHPARGFASLRARAGGPDGTSVQQTVIRAYQIS